MKKTLLAAALFGICAGAAQAESSVTLYGVIDTGIGYNRIKGPNGTQSRIGMINGVESGSRWGLKGVEDLGDGLKAVFKLESGFDSGSGNQSQGGRLFGRQATIGFANDAWGSLEFGRQYNISSVYLADIDPFYTSYGQANMGMGFSAANSTRWGNMIMYKSPNINGFELGVGYSFEVDGNDDTNGFATADNTRGITAGVRYGNGPFSVALTYDQLNGNNSQEDATPRQYAIGATYDFEVVKLAAAYGRTTDGWFTGQALPGSDESFGGDAFGSNVFVDGFKANSTMLGLTAPVGGATKVFVSWQRVDPSNDRLTGDDATMNEYGLGAIYDLSKRTSVYGYGSYATNYAFHDDAKSTEVGVGIRHMF